MSPATHASDALHGEADAPPYGVRFRLRGGQCAAPASSSAPEIFNFRSGAGVTSASAASAGRARRLSIPFFLPRTPGRRRPGRRRLFSHSDLLRGLPQLIGEAGDECYTAGTGSSGKSS